MVTHLWPPLGAWIRGAYFQLRESIAPHVDFDLVGAIGDFCSIPLEIKRWHALALEVRLSNNPEARQRLLAAQAAVGQDIRARLGTGDWIRDWAGQHDLAPTSLLRTAFDAWRAPDLRFEPAALDAVAQAVRETTRALPQLLIGAVDVDSGAFVACSSEHSPLDAGITLDAVVASASLPWVFKAQSIGIVDPETHAPRRIACWDGLFSQNPPIKNFVSAAGDRVKKPDAIWILQINADHYDFNTRVVGSGAGDALWHRRDTLSGNLSLNQEVAFIEAVNARLDDPGQRFGPHDKPIEVVRIVMDGDAVGGVLRKELGLFSKFDRDPGLARALLAHGRDQAECFLALRAQADDLWGTLAEQVGMIGARPSSRLEHALPYLPGRDHLVAGLVAPDVITIEGASLASLRWHASEVELDGRIVRIRGSTALAMQDGHWGVGETRLLDVEEHKPPPAGASRDERSAARRRGAPRQGEGSGPALH